MTPEQQKIVEANMGLVGKVIKEKVRRLGQPDTPSYEDLFQAGCIGLCEAAITDKGGCFSTYAYRLIWNEICLELTVQGYTSKEIGAIVGADPGTVRMWMTRARKYLKSLPELRAFGYPEAV